MLIFAPVVAFLLSTKPLAISVVGGEHIDNTGSFNVGRLQQLTPTLQFYSSNPRNTAVNIRGIGVPFGLTNDGIEQGVGIYVDDVYYSRVASATFDFLDVAQIEVLRARRPLLESYDNALKTNPGWLNLADRAQTEPERIERFSQAKERLSALTAADVQAMAARYLKPEERLEIVVLPRAAE